MDTTLTYRIQFLNASPAQANDHAADLAHFLRNAVPGREKLKVERERTTEDAQDFGATVVLILGTGAAVAVAKGIQSWLARTGTAIEITDEKGHLVATNVDANSAASIVESWSRLRGKR